MIDAKRSLKGRHVFYLLLAFFSAIIVVNLVFAYFAITTFSGIETENAYVKGLRYNEKLAAASRQADLGWQSRLEHQLSDDRLTLNVAFIDATGRPLDGLRVTAKLYRPANGGYDQFLDLIHMGKGQYQVEVDLPHMGQWGLDLEARDSDEITYLEERRLWLN